MSIYDLSTARTMALNAQQLVNSDLRSEALPGEDELYQVVRDLGCVQIDTLHVVQRSHYLVLWSRLGNYSTAAFDRLVYDPAHRRLFEGWQHAASFIPLEDYRFQIPRMRSIRQDSPEMFVKWLDEPGSEEVLQMVRERITAEGPLRARDFKYDGPKRGSWWDWKPAKNALENLYSWGELMIAERVNFQRVYDLQERVLPEWVDASEPTPEMRDRYWLELGVRALGICLPLQAADYSYLKRNSVRNSIHEMIEAGVFIEVAVRMSDGGIQSHIIHHRDQQILDQIADGVILPQRTTFLSPFDNLFWGRGRDEQFWGFKNLLEAYKPASDRIWGYFNMPILHNGRLVGKIDPKLDRKKSRLIVKSIHLEGKVDPDEYFAAHIAEAFKSFMEFHGAKDLEIESCQPADVRESILALL